MSLKRTRSARPNKRQYEDLDDSRDTRVPLHNDEAFMHGLSFTAKFIGSLEVSKPSSRVEIVSCMRRIRYEFRAKSLKKTKASINISVSGVKVTKYIKKKRRKRKKNPEEIVADPQVILETPIYRIFYVSHDSLDKKIFSFIARVETGNARKTFICAVFKAYKKSHALRIVRTIGQAFDICCKLQQSPDAATIPGLMPPEKLKKLQEKKDGGDEEGTCVDDVDGAIASRAPAGLSPNEPLLNNFSLDMSILESSELPPNAIVTCDDDYEVNLMEYQKHLYSLGQSLLLNNAEMTQATNEESLLDGYKLTPAQRQLMVLQFRLKQDQGLGNVFMPAMQSNAGRQDSIASLPLPTPPPNRMKIASRGKFTRPGVGVTENVNRDDSTLGMLKTSEGGESAVSATGAAAATDDNVPTDLLVDTSIPEERTTNINPFTSVTLLEDDDHPMPSTDAQWVDMQRAQTAQLQLLKDQLASETASRIDAQAKSHHVMRQNKILAAYVMHISAQLKRYKAKDPALANDDVAMGGSSGRLVSTAGNALSTTPGQSGTVVLYESPGTAAATAAASAAAAHVPAPATMAAIPETIPVVERTPAPAAEPSSASPVPLAPPPTTTATPASAAAQPATDMELLTEVLAASHMKSATPASEEEFRVRDEEEEAGAALLPAPMENSSPVQQGRFSPFTFQPEDTSTPQALIADVQDDKEDGRFSPFQEFTAIDAAGGGGQPATAGPSSAFDTGTKPVVLFELPRPVTPLSSDDADDNDPLYPNTEPAYMPLQDGAGESADELK